MQEHEPLRLGGNIELKGFTGLDGGTMVIVKKIVGSFARKCADRVEGFERLSLDLRTEPALDLRGSLVRADGSREAASQTANLFFALDDVLKTLEKE